MARIRRPAGTRARQYVRDAWQEEPRTTSLSLTGRIIALDLGGTFDIKISAGKAKRYKVHMPEGVDILSLDLQLGATVSAQVDEVRRVRRVGLVSEPRYELVALGGAQAAINAL